MVEPAVSVLGLTYRYRGLLLSLGARAPGNLGVGPAVITFLLLICSFMLGGREQVAAVEESIAAGGEWPEA
jgi:hypothetical protein